jgi:hypothetical protein
MSHDDPEREAVLQCVARVEAATGVLKAYAEAYVTLRDTCGAADPVSAAEPQGKLVVPQLEALVSEQISLADHFPKMFQAGDAASWLVEKSMEANDAAAAYSKQVKESMCPELMARARVDQLAEKKAEKEAEKEAEKQKAQLVDTSSHEGETQEEFAARVAAAKARAKERGIRISVDRRLSWSAQGLATVKTRACAVQ